MTPSTPSTPFFPVTESEQVLLSSSLDSRPGQDDAANRRQSQRYEVSVPVHCIGILPSLELDHARQWSGLLTDISSGGAGLRLADAGDLHIGDLLLLRIDNQGSVRFHSLRVCNLHHRGSQTVVNATLNTPLSPLFAQTMVYPSLDRMDMTYLMPFSELTLKSLESEGVITSIFLDRVLVCPACHALPTVRRGCGACLSSRTEQRRMIHHFACAHVDFAEKFETAEGLQCPKCRGRKLIVGADFEYSLGPKRCLDCGRTELEAEIGHCMNCEQRFDMTTAYDLEMYGYHVHRLDILDLIREA